jgi:transposase
MSGNASMKFQKKNEQSMPVRDFFKMFPDDETCLAHVFENRFGQGFECPKCKRAAKWYRIEAERAYSCQWCGHHIHPTVNTPFEDTRTPLQLWFYAIYLFTTSRHGVSGKELERQLGVTYKTAWRIGHQIRKHMAQVDGEHVLRGIVEVDETYMGGHQAGKAGRGATGKTIIVGMLERGGRIETAVVENAGRAALGEHIQEHVAPNAEIHTDEWPGYGELERKGYGHKTVGHNAKEYVLRRGKDVIHVNGVESFWKHFKASVKGTHIHVSKKHMEKYAKEFEFRFNNRNVPKTMFPRLVSEFLALKVGAPPSALAS